MGMKVWNVKFGNYKDVRTVIANNVLEAIKKAEKFKRDFQYVPITMVYLIAEED